MQPARASASAICNANARRAPGWPARPPRGKGVPHPPALAPAPGAFAPACLLPRIAGGYCSVLTSRTPSFSLYVTLTASPAFKKGRLLLAEMDAT